MKTVKKYDDFLNKNTENVSEKFSKSVLEVEDDVYASFDTYNFSVSSMPKDYDKDSIEITMKRDGEDFELIEAYGGSDYSEEEVKEAVELVKSELKKHPRLSPGGLLKLSDKTSIVLND